ncbi:uncharacterized protein LOC135400916 isoform X2 [Ornithodoros turicata]|uniref:uncharacterized protein LOC135400916 isoform X2 n=1 Tax=Ornithodoros turicata TaxID=34597 RepID=UPI003139C93E
MKLLCHVLLALLCTASCISAQTRSTAENSTPFVRDVSSTPRFFNAQSNTETNSKSAPPIEVASTAIRTTSSDPNSTHVPMTTTEQSGGDASRGLTTSQLLMIVLIPLACIILVAALVARYFKKKSDLRSLVETI